MPKVFVHGNPETVAIWGPVKEALSERGVEDVVTLSPPGFGVPSPPGWDGLPSSYVRWLLEEIEKLDGEIDIVGHDWGAGHVFGLLAEKPTAVRSWAADCAGLLHPDYQWHDMAQVWQTPERGEAAVHAMIELKAEDRTAAYSGLGLPPDIAKSMADGFTADMGQCILNLYRAAMQPALAQLGSHLVALKPRPGLVIDATDDPYVGSELGREMVERVGAELLTLDGQGHWWMVTSPDKAAEGLIEFWNGVDQTK